MTSTGEEWATVQTSVSWPEAIKCNQFLWLLYRPCRVSSTRTRSSRTGVSSELGWVSKRKDWINHRRGSGESLVCANGGRCAAQKSLMRFRVTQWTVKTCSESYQLLSGPLKLVCSSLPLNWTDSSAADSWPTNTSSDLLPFKWQIWWLIKRSNKSSINCYFVTSYL